MEALCENIRIVGQIKEGLKLCKGSLREGTSGEMMQSEDGNHENKGDKYDTQKLLQNPYLLCLSRHLTCIDKK